MVQDKLTTDMGSRKLADKINRELKEINVRDFKGRRLSIEKTTITGYLTNALRKSILFKRKTKKRKSEIL